MGRLSAQCTDARVNIVCRELFARFPTPESMADCDLSELEKIVKPCGLFRTKAKNLRDASRMLVDEYGGVLPDDMDSLLRFPGVGRKIANLLLGDVFHKPAVVTDTHCIRICGRLGFYPETLKDPQKIEKILAAVIEPEKQSDFCHRIVSSEEIETSVAAAFRNLIFSPEKEDGYRTAMLRSGFHNESSYTIMALRLKTTRKIRKLSDLWKQYSFSMGRILKKSAYPACAFQQENNLILVRQKSSPAEMKRLYTAVQRLLDKQDSLFAGISTVEEGWGKVPELYSEAVSALTVACQRRVPCMEYADLGIYKVLFGVRDTSILSDYVKSTLGVLMEYDRKNNTDYVQTLRVYLDSNGSVQQVAQKLNFHRNTVNYKMKMIREILQTELRDTDKMNYMLAFCIMEMLGAV